MVESYTSVRYKRGAYLIRKSFEEKTKHKKTSTSIKAKPKRTTTPAESKGSHRTRYICTSMISRMDYPSVEILAFIDWAFVEMSLALQKTLRSEFRDVNLLFLFFSNIQVSKKQNIKKLMFWPTSSIIAMRFLNFFFDPAALFFAVVVEFSVMKKKPNGYFKQRSETSRIDHSRDVQRHRGQYPFRLAGDTWNKPSFLGVRWLLSDEMGFGENGPIY